MTDTQTTTEPDINEHLRGPWRAILTDTDGFVLDDLTDLTDEDEVNISIRRGTALPSGPDSTEDERMNLRLPNPCYAGDIIRLWDSLYVEDGDPSTDAPARWAQAQAMADGLNAAAQRLPDPTGFITTVTP
ncbi:hypothetical protein BDK92_7075 [Micromonospora pisi]|uniref:Uncharacterized protein n=1 Tax=Micromonospora pisi TaxID=589240 RepID=A0A495JUG8_9ACTN|nr:hypothetical protein [Micromonospora pisi]RKR92633.1 hypothetical protein BDK92_7075 [Micromonospora pisi]